MAQNGTDSTNEDDENAVSPHLQDVGIREGHQNGACTRGCNSLLTFASVLLTDV